MERQSSGEGPSSPSGTRRLLTAGQIFDGTKLLREALVVLNGGVVEFVGPRSAYTSSQTVEDLGEGTLLTCGMMDLQMNGGGGAQFNEDISEATLEKMLEVCLRHGTSSFLPSMLTSSFDDVRRSLEVVKAWVGKHGLTRGVVGIHLEGPFLSLEKKGIHVESLL
jgi:N-acetylglucosamine-6-phosphate deacetylase